MKKCGKCGKIVNITKIALVAPINDKGEHLECVNLCYECDSMWQKYYTLKGLIHPDFGSAFDKEWSRRWKYFLSSRFSLKEKVIFT